MLSRRRLVLTALFALGGFLVVANSGTFVVSDPSVAPIPEALPGKGETGMDGGVVAPGIVDTNGVAPDQRSIIRRADLSLTVEAVEAAIDQATAAVLALGGEVSSSSIGGWIEPMPIIVGNDGTERASALEPATAYVLFRVPSAQIDAAVRALRTIGETTGFSTGSDDVSATVIDLEARLTALQAAESSYLDLIDRAANVAEVMSVYSALTEVRAQIESLEAQARTIADQVEMAALSVSFTREAQPIVEATEGFDPAAIAERALGDLAGIARGLIGTLIYGSVLLAPVAAIGALVVALRHIRRR